MGNCQSASISPDGTGIRRDDLVYWLYGSLPELVWTQTPSDRAEFVECLAE